MSWFSGRSSVKERQRERGGGGGRRGAGHWRRSAGVTVAALTLLGMTACSSGADDTSGPAKASTSTPAQASPSTPAGQTYATKAFVVPFTVTVDPALKSPPNPDSRNWLSWDAAASDPDDAVRFLVPVIVYPPGSDTPQAPAKDYLKYLQSQAKDGAEFSNMTKITVGGHQATLMNITTSKPEGFLSGSLGCSERAADKHDGDRCRGIQPDFILRLAVIDLGKTTLLTWARMQKNNPDAAFVAMYERMLTTVQFR